MSNRNASKSSKKPVLHPDVSTPRSGNQAHRTIAEQAREFRNQRFADFNNFFTNGAPGTSTTNAISSSDIGSDQVNEPFGASESPIAESEESSNGPTGGNGSETPETQDPEPETSSSRTPESHETFKDHYQIFMRLINNDLLHLGSSKDLVRTNPYQSIESNDTSKSQKRTRRTRTQPGTSSSQSPGSSGSSQVSRKSKKKNQGIHEISSRLLEIAKRAEMVAEDRSNSEGQNQEAQNLEVQNAEEAEVEVEQHPLEDQNLGMQHSETVNSQVLGLGDVEQQDDHLEDQNPAHLEVQNQEVQMLNPVVQALENIEDQEPQSLRGSTRPTTNRATESVGQKIPRERTEDQPGTSGALRPSEDQYVYGPPEAKRPRTRAPIASARPEHVNLPQEQDDRRPGTSGPSRPPVDPPEVQDGPPEPKKQRIEAENPVQAPRAAAIRNRGRGGGQGRNQRNPTPPPPPPPPPPTPPPRPPPPPRQLPPGCIMDPNGHFHMVSKYGMLISMSEAPDALEYARNHYPSGRRFDEKRHGKRQRRIEGPGPSVPPPRNNGAPGSFEASRSLNQQAGPSTSQPRSQQVQGTSKTAKESRQIADFQREGSLAPLEQIARIPNMNFHDAQLVTNLGFPQSFDDPDEPGPSTSQPSSSSQNSVPSDRAQQHLERMTKIAEDKKRNSQDSSDAPNTTTNPELEGSCSAPSVSVQQRVQYYPQSSSNAPATSVVQIDPASALAVAIGADVSDTVNSTESANAASVPDAQPADSTDNAPEISQGSTASTLLDPKPEDEEVSAAFSLAAFAKAPVLSVASKDRQDLGTNGQEVQDRDQDQVQDHLGPSSSAQGSPLIDLEHVADLPGPVSAPTALESPENRPHSSTSSAQKSIDDPEASIAPFSTAQPARLAQQMPVSPQPTAQSQSPLADQQDPLDSDATGPSSSAPSTPEDLLEREDRPSPSTSALQEPLDDSFVASSPPTSSTSDLHSPSSNPSAQVTPDDRPSPSTSDEEAAQLELPSLDSPRGSSSNRQESEERASRRVEETEAPSTSTDHHRASVSPAQESPEEAVNGSEPVAARPVQERAVSPLPTAQSQLSSTDLHYLHASDVQEHVAKLPGPSSAPASQESSEDRRFPSTSAPVPTASSAPTAQSPSLPAEQHESSTSAVAELREPSSASVSENPPATSEHHQASKEHVAELPGPSSAPAAQEPAEDLHSSSSSDVQEPLDDSELVISSSPTALDEQQDPSASDAQRASSSAPSTSEDRPESEIRPSSSLSLVFKKDYLQANIARAPAATTSSQDPVDQDAELPPAASYVRRYRRSLEQKASSAQRQVQSAQSPVSGNRESLSSFLPAEQQDLSAPSTSEDRPASENRASSSRSIVLDDDDDFEAPVHQEAEYPLLAAPVILQARPAPPAPALVHQEAAAVPVVPRFIESTDELIIDDLKAAAIRKVKQNMGSQSFEDQNVKDLVKQLVNGDLDDIILDFSHEFWDYEGDSDLAIFKQFLLETLFLRKSNFLAKSRVRRRITQTLPILRSLRNLNVPRRQDHLRHHLDRITEAQRELETLARQHPECQMLLDSYKLAFDFNTEVFKTIFYNEVDESTDRVLNSLFNLQPLRRMLEEIGEVRKTTEDSTQRQIHLRDTIKKLAKIVLERTRDPFDYSLTHRDIGQSINLMVAEDFDPECNVRKDRRNLFGELIGMLGGRLDPAMKHFFPTRHRNLQDLKRIIENRKEQIVVNADLPLLVEPCQIGTAYLLRPELRMYNGEVVRIPVLTVAAVREKTESINPHQRWPGKPGDQLIPFDWMSNETLGVLVDPRTQDSNLVFYNDRGPHPKDCLAIGTVRDGCPIPDWVQWSFCSFRVKLSERWAPL